MEAPEIEIRVLESVKIEIGKLQLWPGDILVVRLPDDWTAEMCGQFDGYLRTLGVLPPGVKTMMLPAAAEIGVLSPSLPRSKLQ